MQKGPYFNPVQYISPLPEGYLQASSNIANTLGKAAQGLGQSIASSIEQYTKNKEEGQFLDEKFQMTTGNLEKYKTDPKYAEDPRAKKLAEGVGKFSAMSNSQKKSFLNNADFAVSQFDREAAIDYKKLQDQRQYEFDAQRALIDVARLRSDEALTAEKIAEMRRGFIPTATTVQGRGGPIDLISVSKDNYTLAPKAAAAPLPLSDIGKKQFDRDQALLSGNKKDAEDLQKEIDAQVKKEAEGAGTKALSADQSNALNFSLRLIQNEDFIKNNKYDATAFFDQSYIPNRLTSDDKKAYDAAKNNWIAAALRKESGAAIGPDEYNKYDKQYFPQGGDGKTVIDQKQLMRNQLMLGMTAGIGPNSSDYLDRYQLKVSPVNNETPTPVSGKSPSGVDYTVIRNPKKRS